MARILLTGLAFILTTGVAHASTQVYTPVDPAFGGSALNSSYLLGTAGAQDGYKAPTTTTTTDPSALFVQQLQAQLLGALSSQITQAIFGPNAAQSGKIVFGDQTIAYVKSLTEVTLTITNTTTGAVTTVEIPVLQTNTGGN